MVGEPVFSVLCNGCPSYFPLCFETSVQNVYIGTVRGNNVIVTGFVNFGLGFIPWVLCFKVDIWRCELPWWGLCDGGCGCLVYVFS